MQARHPVGPGQPCTGRELAIKQVPVAIPNQHTERDSAAGRVCILQQSLYHHAPPYIYIYTEPASQSDGRHFLLPLPRPRVTLFLIVLLLLFFSLAKLKRKKKSLFSPEGKSTALLYNKNWFHPLYNTIVQMLRTRCSSPVVCCFAYMRELSSSLHMRSSISSF